MLTSLKSRHLFIPPSFVEVIVMVTTSRLAGNVMYKTGFSDDAVLDNLFVHNVRRLAGDIVVSPVLLFN